MCSAAAAPGATLLLDCPLPPDEVWDALPRQVQEKILAKHIDVYAIDAGRIAREVGLAGRTNTILQTCFFAISGVLPREEAIAKIKAAIAKTYGRRGAEVVERNQAAVDRALAGLHRIEVPGPGDVHQGAAPGRAGARAGVRPHRHRRDAGRPRRRAAGQRAARGRHLSERHGGVRETQRLRARRGVGSRSVYPVRQLQLRLPAQRDQVHLLRRVAAGRGAIGSSVRRRWMRVGSPIPASPSRCTWRTAPAASCACRPARSAAPGDPARKAINLAPREPLLAAERDNIAFFETLPVADRSRVDFGTVRGTQFLQPLFEFSGACAGCGETPYVKLLSQLFGDRLMIANATGCSSIYGGNLPTTPWTANADGRGPAWSNSLFEDNAEFGLGFRLAADRHAELARGRLAELRDAIGAELADDILGAPQLRESELRAQHDRVAELKRRLDGLDGPAAADLRSVVDHLVRRSVWIVGGDGWAYDIGSGGLDHVLASGRNVNVLVLDTEVYSNTGGQASKATPLGAVAKFAASGQGRTEEGPRAAGDRVRQRVCRPGRDGRRPAADAAGLPRGGGL